jgi:hypothetical protein
MLECKPIIGKILMDHHAYCLTLIFVKPFIKHYYVTIIKFLAVYTLENSKRDISLVSLKFIRDAELLKCEYHSISDEHKSN